MGNLLTRLNKYADALEKSRGQAEYLSDYLTSLKVDKDNVKEYCEFLMVCEDQLRQVDALRGLKIKTKSREIANNLMPYIGKLGQALPKEITYTTGGKKKITGSPLLVCSAIATQNYSSIKGERPKHEKGLLCSLIALCAEAITIKALEACGCVGDKAKKVESILEVMKFQASLQDSLATTDSYCRTIMNKYKNERSIVADRGEGKGQLKWTGKEKEEDTLKQTPENTKKKGDALEKRIVESSTGTFFNLVRGTNAKHSGDATEKYGPCNWNKAFKILTQVNTNVQYYENDPTGKTGKLKKLPTSEPEALQNDATGIRVAIGGQHKEEMVAVRDQLRAVGYTIRGKNGA